MKEIWMASAPNPAIRPSTTCLIGYFEGEREQVIEFVEFLVPGFKDGLTSSLDFSLNPIAVIEVSELVQRIQSVKTAKQAAENELTALRVTINFKLGAADSKTQSRSRPKIQRETVHINPPPNPNAASAVTPPKSMVVARKK